MRLELEPSTLAATLRGLPVGVWVGRAPDGVCVYANEAFERITGSRPLTDARVGNFCGAYRIFGRDGQPYPDSALAFVRALAEQQPVVADDLVVHRPDGAQVYLRTYGTPLRGADGRIAWVVVTLLDITAEVRRAEQGDLARHRLELAVRRAPIIIFDTDAEGRVTHSEGAGLKSLGVRDGELVGRSVFELYDDPTVHQNTRRVLAGESISTFTELGTAVVEGWMTPIRDAQGAVVGLTGVMTDVTARHRSQQAVSRSERMAAMGTLAASVAHEINNPLAYVLEGLRSLERELGAGLSARHRRLLNDVKEGAERVRTITSDLQTFTHRDEPTAEVDVARAVRTAAQMLASQLEPHARLYLELEDGVTVQASEPRIVQVLMNLLLNAKQAVQQVQRGSHHEIRVRVAAVRDEALIEVTDTGPGIAPEVRENIFEPFVTTKPVGEGSGLGLFVCRNLVAELKGKIEAESPSHGGARFRVRLPRAPTPERRQGARVLVIDDNVNLGRVMASALELQQHQVTVMHTGREAVEHLASGQRYDVIFCDLMMADVSGMDVYDELEARQSGAAGALVFMTGGAFTERAQKFLASVSNERLQKPFDICAQVERILARRGA
ncbi:MAG: PAS domain-containing protein [Archangiaceae bacterium]|nr:PAS domain-containing protein [Archangiaceae bacterium]